MSRFTASCIDERDGLCLHSLQSVKYESFFVLACYVDKQHLDMCTYKVRTQQRRRWLATFDIAIYNR